MVESDERTRMEGHSFVNYASLYYRQNQTGNSYLIKKINDKFSFEIVSFYIELDVCVDQRVCCQFLWSCHDFHQKRRENQRKNVNNMKLIYYLFWFITCCGLTPALSLSFSLFLTHTLLKIYSSSYLLHCHHCTFTTSILFDILFLLVEHNFFMWMLLLRVSSFLLCLSNSISLSLFLSHSSHRLTARCSLLGNVIEVSAPSGTNHINVILSYLIATT